MIDKKLLLRNRNFSQGNDVLFRYEKQDKQDKPSEKVEPEKDISKP